jgi:opacity protein-like surface antigen
MRIFSIVICTSLLSFIYTQSVSASLNPYVSEDEWFGDSIGYPQFKTDVPSSISNDTYYQSVPSSKQDIPNDTAYQGIPSSEQEISLEQSSDYYSTTKIDRFETSIELLASLQSEFSHYSALGLFNTPTPLGMKMSINYKPATIVSYSLYMQYLYTALTVNPDEQKLIKDYEFTNQFYTLGIGLGLWTNSILFNAGIGAGQTDLSCSNTQCKDYFVKDNAQTLAYEAHLELKWRFSNSMSVNLGYRYLMTDEEINLSDNLQLKHYFNLSIYSLGVSIYF